MNRRDFLRAIAGAASALILPMTVEANAEAARRIWALGEMPGRKPAMMNPELTRISAQYMAREWVWEPASRTPLITTYTIDQSAPCDLVIGVQGDDGGWMAIPGVQDFTVSYTYEDMNKLLGGLLGEPKIAIEPSQLVIGPVVWERMQPALNLQRQRATRQRTANPRVKGIRANV